LPEFAGTQLQDALKFEDQLQANLKPFFFFYQGPNGKGAKIRELIEYKIRRNFTG
jgi:hypothetical protein